MLSSEGKTNVNGTLGNGVGYKIMLAPVSVASHDGASGLHTNALDSEKAGGTESVNGACGGSIWEARCESSGTALVGCGWVIDISEADVINKGWVDL